MVRPVYRPVCGLSDLDLKKNKTKWRWSYLSAFHQEKSDWCCNFASSQDLVYYLAAVLSLFAAYEVKLSTTNILSFEPRNGNIDETTVDVTLRGVVKGVEQCTSHPLYLTVSCTSMYDIFVKGHLNHEDLATEACFLLCRVLFICGHIIPV